MYPIISNIICLVIGAMIGVGCMCLMVAAGKSDREMELMEKRLKQTKEQEAKNEEG